ncbi:MAG: hypothetical protein HGA79_07265 [Anaerolineales bacterium]|nr:hypothetical protein [Anaerolineales bacterium]
MFISSTLLGSVSGDERPSNRLRFYPRSGAEWDIIPLRDIIPEGVRWGGDGEAVQLEKC